MSGFDRVARIYRRLEYLAFGDMLQRARIAHLSHAATAQRALLVGDGDGRFLAALLAANPHVHVTSIDASAAMLALAEPRVATADHARVLFLCADIRTAALPRNCDLIVTLFSLDCFTDEDAARVVARLGDCAAPHAQWLFADFAVPARGLARWHAQVIVRALYTFFRWRTGIDARTLPNSDAHIQRAGFRACERRFFRHGLVTSVVYARSS